MPSLCAVCSNELPKSKGGKPRPVCDDCRVAPEGQFRCLYCYELLPLDRMSKSVSTSCNECRRQYHRRNRAKKEGEADTFVCPVCERTLPIEQRHYTMCRDCREVDEGYFRCTSCLEVLPEDMESKSNNGRCNACSAEYMRERRKEEKEANDLPSLYGTLLKLKDRTKHWADRVEGAIEQAKQLGEDSAATLMQELLAVLREDVVMQLSSVLGALPEVEIKRRYRRRDKQRAERRRA